MKKVRLIGKFLVLVGAVSTLSGCVFTPAKTEKSLIVNDPNATNYKVGDVFNSFINNGGLSVKVKMSDDSEQVVAKGTYTYKINSKTDSTYFVNPAKEFKNAGDYVVSVSKSGLETVKYDIKVKENTTPTKVLTGISVSGQTTSCFAGDTYTFDGVVTATYSDGTTADVSDKAIFNYPSTKVSGTFAVAVSYSENNVQKTTSYNLVVKEKTIRVTLQSISLNGQTKSFIVGNPFIFGGTVTAHYSDGSTKNVTSLATFTGYNMNSAGTQTVTVSYNENGVTKTETYQITVDASEVLITSISISPTSKDMYVGDTFTAAPTILPSNATTKTLTWTSTDSTVATVSSGKVSALKAGKTTIKATAQDGSGVTASCEVTVSNVLVTNLSISSTLTLTVDETSTLSPTITPSNATNKTLSWTSSKPAIASVDSNGKVTALAVGTTTITAKTTDGSNKTATCNVTVNEKPLLDDWTLLIYMCGADLESDSSQGGAATEDLTEIYSLRNSLPSDVNVVVQAGGARSWKSTYSSVISKDKCNRFHLTKTGYVKDSQTSKVNMGLESSLESFVEWGLTTYPAEKVGLVFWNHGGAMDGCCFDEQNSNDGLTPAEVSSAIPTAISRSNYNKNLEFIGYDCCLMSVQDIAGLNAEYANYMIASEESEYGYGWTYNEWVDDLFEKKSTETILKACVDSFISEAEYIYKYYYSESCDQTLAYYNLKNWNTYETAWENFASYLSSNVITSSSKWDTFANVINKAKKYGRYTDSQAQSYNNGYLCDIFDVKDALNKIKADSNYKSNSTLMSKVSDVETAFTGLSVYSKCGSAAGNSNGICMFCPLSGYNEKAVQYDSDNTCFTYWRNLCINYGDWYSYW